MTGDAKTEEIEMALLLEALQRRYDYDFRGYAEASLQRRLGHARDRLGCRNFSQLQERLLHEPAVLPQLLGYLTVQVSEMFRDPGYFRALRQQVLPHLQTYPSIRVWLAGCSTGEEFYSLAILFREEGLERRTTFYATDINPTALEQAQAGVYDLDRLALFTRNHQLSGARCSLSEYYSAGYRAAVFDKSLRQRVVFSTHSLVADSVFAEVHLVSCRNVLIYFTAPLQDRAIGLFKEALVRRGFLGLGAKESLRRSAHRGAFDEYLRAECIYQKRSEVCDG